MKKELKKLFVSLLFLCSFVIWTILIKVVDVQPIGPNDSVVGFSSLNGWFHNLTGVHMWLYNVTDWLGFVPLFVCLLFAIVGLIQWIKRKSIFKVDLDIILLGVFYVLVIIGYLLFEKFAINYRPILINGYLEASYPSSTTLLVLTVMSTAFIQCNKRIKNQKIKYVINIINIVFMTFMVVGRLISGVHWITDIIGGILLSSALVELYAFSVNYFAKNKSEV